MSEKEQEMQAQIDVLKLCVASLIALVADDERARVGKCRLLSEEQRAKLFEDLWIREEVEGW